MTNLDKDVKKAKQLGLSYGRYKAIGYDPYAPPVFKKKKAEKLCPVCGKVVEKPRIKFCSEECMEAHGREVKRQQSHDRYWSKVRGGKGADS